jgi:hypothetical protein
MARVAWTGRLRPDRTEGPLFGPEVAEDGLTHLPEIFRLH